MRLIRPGNWKKPKKFYKKFVDNHSEVELMAIALILALVALILAIIT